VGSNLYVVLTLILYAVGAVHILLQALTHRRGLSSWTVVTTLAGFALHTASLALRWNEVGHFPAIGLRDVASFLAWATVLVFLVTYLRTRVEALGLAVYPTAFLLMAVAVGARAPTPADPALHTVFLPVHAALAFLGYAALFVAFAMGVLYLIQERELKARSPRVFYYLIPSLERCDTISGRSVIVGFTLLTLAILTGLLWSHNAHGHYWSGDAKEWAAVTAWIIYIGLLLARYRTGWGGRRAALLGIAGFAAVAFVFFTMTVLPAAAPR
jgi:cytochrome c-type biogenesis protein CcsB